MTTWVDITNAEVAAGAPITTALMTSLRDNIEGIAQRATGAPKIFGVPYDYQEFTASGTWTKPSNAESGDKVVVQVVGGGASGVRDTSTNDPVGGGGGGGIIMNIENVTRTGSVASRSPVKRQEGVEEGIGVAILGVEALRHQQERRHVTSFHGINWCRIGRDANGLAIDTKHGCRPRRRPRSCRRTGLWRRTWGIRL